MMAENTDVNVKEKLRQSMDYPPNFNAKRLSVPIKEASISDDNEVFCVSPQSTSTPLTTDSRFKCWCHEIFDLNQRPEKCNPAWDETPSDKLPERDSVISINSFDSGYESTGIFLHL